VRAGIEDRRVERTQLAFDPLSAGEAGVAVGDVDRIGCDRAAGASAASVASASALRALAATRQPSAARRKATARPMPVPAPVSHAILGMIIPLL
jgi:hypothetical protein